jgi:hypothetical protein
VNSWVFTIIFRVKRTFPRNVGNHVVLKSLTPRSTRGRSCRTAVLSYHCPRGTNLTQTVLRTTIHRREFLNTWQECQQLKCGFRYLPVGRCTEASVAMWQNQTAACLVCQGLPHPLSFVNFASDYWFNTEMSQTNFFSAVTVHMMKVHISSNGVEELAIIHNYKCYCRNYE